MEKEEGYRDQTIDFGFLVNARQLVRHFPSLPRENRKCSNTGSLPVTSTLSISRSRPRLLFVVLVDAFSERSVILSTPAFARK
jgi:hypothetical protein